MRDFGPKWNPSSNGAGASINPASAPRGRIEARGASRLKRGFDCLVALAAGAALAPLMIAVGAGVALADGLPIFYSQTRIGRNGRTFRIFKFRTMRRDAETGADAVWAVADDPRCTRLGAWLRRTGLDELPQLWNVIRGEMSIVGPRPERPEFAEQFNARHADYRDREQVLPGITGYAQVHGWRGDTDLRERVRHDLHYIRHWSLLLDFRILLLTVRYGWSQGRRNGLTR